MDIFQASSANNLAQVTRLLEQDPQLVGARDHDQRIALHHAALHNSQAVMQFLLSKGADPNARSTCGDGPLHLAQRSETVRLLIDAGAEPHNEDNAGVSSMDLAVREGREDLFWELSRACDYYSSTFQFLLACQKASLAASTRMGGDYHCLTVERLGHQAGKECCLGWRHGGTIAGWNCYPLAELEHCFFGDPLEELPQPDRASRPNGTIQDIYPFSLPRKWLLIQKDPYHGEALEDLLDGQGLEVCSCSGPGQARRLFRNQAFDGVIADAKGALVLRDIYLGKLKGRQPGQRVTLLVLTQPSCLEAIPELFRLDANIRPDAWVQAFMTWRD
jgi:hypothetical protein